ncbi:MAG: tRNA (adenosine(37)-N6)-threonylcarbamoyltransferase complex transferase subunit TsaD [Crocinitomicaceae bacterium]|nr:tRNA (adenosine(37)-N6)-threonylcarbamoyltransferase complex transferase subunit TsaD [Crocinitomicaceae bacterium]
MAEENIIILGIESSCDDTSVAVSLNSKILSNVVSSQVIHSNYGGVVPELASRAHEKNIIPVVDRAIKESGIELKDLDAIAFTRGPGLLGSLLVGTSFAKSLGLALNKPIIDVHHMKAHILAHFIEQENKQMPTFPFLCLTVSGGHTQIVLIKDHLDMEIIGSTIDDAAGEAFDKGAKILGLNYPGGPLIDKMSKNGNPDKYKFAKPKVKGYDFSFSGLKTSFLYFIQKQTKENPDFIKQEINHLCAGLQKTIVDILIDRLCEVSKDLGIKKIAIAGGVSANSGLRNALKKLEEIDGFDIYIPDFQYCTDNAGMICITAYYQYKAGLFANQNTVCSARI